MVNNKAVLSRYTCLFIYSEKLIPLVDPDKLGLVYKQILMILIKIMLNTVKSILYMSPQDKKKLSKSNILYVNKHFKMSVYLLTFCSVMNNILTTTVGNLKLNTEYVIYL